jgi:hypothetical protein
MRGLSVLLYEPLALILQGRNPSLTRCVILPPVPTPETQAAGAKLLEARLKLTEITKELTQAHANKDDSREARAAVCAVTGALGRSLEGVPDRCGKIY